MTVDETIKEQIHALAADVVHQLATQQYDGLRAARGPVSDFVNAVERFRRDGFTIVDLPDVAYSRFDMYGPNPHRDNWIANFPLWTREHGESDLHLYLVFRKEGGILVAYVDDIYVP